MLSGDNGILQKATDAKTLTERASVVEQARTDVLGYQADNKGGDIDKTQLKTILEKYFDKVPDLTDMGKDAILNTELHTLAKYGTHTITVSEIYNGNFKGEIPKVTGNLNDDEIAGLPNGVVEIAKNDVTNTTIKNNDNIRAVITGEVPIPNGFYYVGGTKDEGVVISDNVADSGKGTSHAITQTLVGNQFVWVPVPNATDFKRYEGYGYQTRQDYISSSSEPFEEGYDTEVSEYMSMYNSVTNNKGFYVARFEASQGSNGYESIQGVYPWTNIPWGISWNDIGTEGCVYQSQQKYTENIYGVTSTLIYGIQWDAIMAWIDSNYITGNCDISNSFVAASKKVEELTITITGESSSTVKNIYDLGGNALEMTMEMNRGDYGMVERITRDNISIWYSPSGRCGFTPRSDIKSNTCGFRTALYL
ncbi:MAG TPA: hypothetical protein DEP51_05715 [Clostridiales bacterium]|nr:hypothetical protein [Clostridiales bacterium]